MTAGVMEIHVDGRLFGTLIDYEYETPWAIARITPVDPAAYDQLARAGDVPGGRCTIVSKGWPPSGPIVLEECGCDGWIRWRWA